MGGSQFYQPATDGTANINTQRYKGETTSDSADLYVSCPFNLLGREHDLMVGGSISTAHGKGKGYWDETFATPNLVDYSTGMETWPTRTGALRRKSPITPSARQVCT